MWVKPEILRLKRVANKEIDRTGFYRMDRNERTIPFDNNILDHIKERLTSDVLTNYPDESELYYRLSKMLGYGLKEDNIIFHTGSDLVIKSIFETYIEKGDVVLLHKPSYAMYSVYGQMYQADLQYQEYDKHCVFNLENYCNTISNLKPKVAVLENPNGFIGNEYSNDELEKIIRITDENDVLLVLDEAYIDFSGNDSTRHILEHKNLIIVRTFSKAWGIAGLRIGYAISNTDRIIELNKVRPMHQFTGVSALVLQVLMDDIDVVNNYIYRMNDSRFFFMNELDRLSINYIYGRTNFLTTELGSVLNIEKFREIALKHKFIFRRPFSEEKWKNWVRIGLLDKERMKEFTELICKEIERR